MFIHEQLYGCAFGPESPMIGLDKLSRQNTIEHRIADLTIVMPRPVSNPIDGQIGGVYRSGEIAGICIVIACANICSYTMMDEAFIVNLRKFQFSRAS